MGFLLVQEHNQLKQSKNRKKTYKHKMKRKEYVVINVASAAKACSHKKVR